MRARRCGFQRAKSLYHEGYRMRAIHDKGGFITAENNGENMPTEIKTITQKYLMTVNCYLVKTPTGYILIDTGLPKRRSDLLRELETAGCKPGDLNLIIITHGHLDHNGNTAYLRERYDARIAMHSGDAAMAESGDMFRGVKGLSGAIVRILLLLVGMSRYDSFRPDIILEGGHDLSEYGFDARVVHVPGHSKGSIGILTAGGDLFCGDILGNTGKPAKTTIVDDSAELDASVERLRTLEIKTVYPGHGKPFRMEQFVENS
jgi:glyoxylase-like metal-dependent hydrolase (beta-lactamase superfamily II)